ncbi:MAG: GrpB family protein [Lachnospiraceae bacterium]|nr:GrpB family protein [Lachnospiraceae bacterium]
MGKKLSEMTLEELWMFFPISLTEYNDEWERQYEEMEVFLEKQLSSCHVVRISHMGSTAIKHIWAKPIVDILVEIASDENMDVFAKIIESNGFIKMSESDGRISFNSGYTENGFAEKVFHLHLRYEGDNDELYFRDYLNDNPDIAKEYQELKISLWHQYEHNRDAYTQAKTEFVRGYTAEAKRQYGKRYDQAIVCGK